MPAYEYRAAGGKPRASGDDPLTTLIARFFTR